MEVCVYNLDIYIDEVSDNPYRLAQIKSDKYMLLSTRDLNRWNETIIKIPYGKCHITNLINTLNKKILNESKFSYQVSRIIDRRDQSIIYSSLDKEYLLPTESI